jgi:hypothetical protein
MKSHPCVKTGGGVPPASQPIQQSTPQPVTLAPCRHINRRGHHCRLFSSIPNLELCPHHARQLQQRKQCSYDKGAAELLGDLTDFSTPDAINFLLGNLVRQLARKRIHRRDAMAIAYVCQLLLGSIAALDRRDALGLTGDRDSGIPRIVFDPPEPIVSDSAKIAALFTTERTTTCQPGEGRP